MSPATPRAHRSGRADWRSTPQTTALPRSVSAIVAANSPIGAGSSLRQASQMMTGNSAIASSASGYCNALMAVNEISPCCWRAARMAGTSCGV